jgi:hypothetical protein
MFENNAKLIIIRRNHHKNHDITSQKRQRNEHELSYVQYRPPILEGTAD